MVWECMRGVEVYDIDIQLEADGMFYSQISKNTAIIRNYFSEIFTKRIHHIS